jgi:hypothetical protein
MFRTLAVIAILTPIAAFSAPNPPQHTSVVRNPEAAASETVNQTPDVREAKLRKQQKGCVWIRPLAPQEPGTKC